MNLRVMNKTDGAVCEVELPASASCLVVYEAVGEELFLVEGLFEVRVDCEVLPCSGDEPACRYLSDGADVMVAPSKAGIARMRLADLGMDRPPSSADLLSAIERRVPPVFVKLLLDAGVHPNDFPKKDRIPLHLAVKHGRDDIVEMLLEAGADPDERSAAACSPLHEAVSRRAVEALVAAGADPDTRNAAGDAPLHLAAEYNRLDAAAALLASGAPVDTLNACSETPLHIAVESASPSFVNLLLKSGASVSRLNRFGWTPLQRAAEAGEAEIINTLAGRSIHSEC